MAALRTELVGRTVEIAAMEAVGGDPAEPRPVIVVHGEAGIGKTSLVGELSARLSGGRHQSR
jgi:predicted ATPase